MAIDAEKLGQLLDRYWPVLVAWVGGERGESEDIVQMAFVKLVVQDPVPVNCVAWLFTVTKRIAINERLSRNKRQVRELHIARRNSCPHRRQTDAESLALREVLEQLDDQQRQIVIARVWGEMTFDELAILFDEPKATVWRLYQAAISNLRERLQGDDDECFRQSEPP